MTYSDGLWINGNIWLAAWWLSSGEESSLFGFVFCFIVFLQIVNYVSRKWKEND